MNKSAIQKFAIWARTMLMEQVAQRAFQYGITKDGYGEENAVTVNGMALSPQEQSQRRELVCEIQAKGYDQVVEEVAYTWFNRFIALRYMEVNNYLPSHIRVFSNAQGAFDPEILKEALHIDLPGLDQRKVAEHIEKNETEALYRYLLLTQCNALNEGLPKMFEKMGGYKGGGYRKWYGNLTEVVNWSEEARAFYKKDHVCRIIPEYLWYRVGITWSLISNNPSFRFLPSDATFDVGGSSVFLKDDTDMNLFLGLLNSKVFSLVQKVVNPTINIQVKDIRVMPVIKRQETIVKDTTENVISVSKADWDSYEISWDFKRHPLV